MHAYVRLRLKVNCHSHTGTEGVCPFLWSVKEIVCLHQISFAAGDRGIIAEHFLPSCCMF